MHIKLFLGAAFTALVSLFAAHSERIAERFSPDAARELVGQITAVEPDGVYMRVDGGGEVLLRMDENTEIQTVQAMPGFVAPELPCFEFERPLDEAELAMLAEAWTGEKVTVTVVDEGGIIRTMTITVVASPCSPSGVTHEGDTGVRPETNSNVRRSENGD